MMRPGGPYSISGPCRYSALCTAGAGAWAASLLDEVGDADGVAVAAPGAGPGGPAEDAVQVARGVVLGHVDAAVKDVDWRQGDAGRGRGEGDGEQLGLDAVTVPLLPGRRATGRGA